MAGNSIGMSDREAFEDLLILSSLRGRDSTGVAFIRTYSEAKVPFTIEKSLGSSGAFVDKHSYVGGALKSSLPDLFIGHTRYATVGEVTIENAHPFVTGDIIGAHNGTLTSNEYIGKDKSDSALMFDDMTKSGIIPTLEALDEGSAFAVSIYDMKEKKLYLSRNEERPLYIGIRPLNGNLYWASESMMLDLIAKRNRFDLKVYHLVPNQLYEFDVSMLSDKNLQPWNTYPIDDHNYKSWYTTYGMSTNYVAPKLSKSEKKKLKALASGDETSKDVTSKELPFNDDIPFGDSSKTSDQDPSGKGGRRVVFLASDDDDYCVSCSKLLKADVVKRMTPIHSGGADYYLCTVCDTSENEQLLRA